MKFQVRRGVFETNSSSVHSITMCNKSDFDKWENGELVYDWGRELIIPITEEIKSKMENDIYSDYYTFDDFFNNDFDKWENGELVYDWGRELIIPITEEIKSKMENDIYSDYYTFDDFFNNYERMDLETFCDSFKTASGEEVVAFGYHGHD